MNPSTEIATVEKGGELVARGSEWQALREQAQTMVKSGFVPDAVKTPEQCLAIMLTGRELGIGPMAALRSIRIIKGQPTLSATLMLGLAYDRIKGFKAEVDSDETHAWGDFSRPGQKVYHCEFSIEDAKRAGLSGKENWRGYPRHMMEARVVAQGARMVAPEACMGLYTPDELGAIDVPAQPVEVDITPPKPEPEPKPKSEAETPGAHEQELLEARKCYRLAAISRFGSDQDGASAATEWQRQQGIEDIKSMPAYAVRNLTARLQAEAAQEAHAEAQAYEDKEVTA